LQLKVSSSSSSSSFLPLLPPSLRFRLSLLHLRLRPRPRPRLLFPSLSHNFLPPHPLSPFFFFFLCVCAVAYGRDLETLLEVFVKPLEEKSILSSEEIRQVFSSQLPTMLQLSRQLLERFQSSSSSSLLPSSSSTPLVSPSFPPLPPLPETSYLRPPSRSSSDSSLPLSPSLQETTSPSLPSSLTIPSPSSLRSSGSSPSPSPSPSPLPSLSLVSSAFFELLEDGSFVQVYKSYCGNRENSRTIISRLLLGNPSFQSFLQTCRSRGGGEDLRSFLIKPVQRICKYPLLLQQIIKSSSSSATSTVPLRPTSPSSPSSLTPSVSTSVSPALSPSPSPTPSPSPSLSPFSPSVLSSILAQEEEEHYKNKEKRTEKEKDRQIEELGLVLEKLKNILSTIDEFDEKEKKQMRCLEKIQNKFAPPLTPLQVFPPSSSPSPHTRKRTHVRTLLFSLTLPSLFPNILLVLVLVLLLLFQAPLLLVDCNRQLLSKGKLREVNLKQNKNNDGKFFLFNDLLLFGYRPSGSKLSAEGGGTGGIGGGGGRIAGRGTGRENKRPYKLVYKVSLSGPYSVTFEVPKIEGVSAFLTLHRLLPIVLFLFLFPSSSSSSSSYCSLHLSLLLPSSSSSRSRSFS
jgi:hypothetical protein